MTRLSDEEIAAIEARVGESWNYSVEDICDRVDERDARALLTEMKRARAEEARLRAVEAAARAFCETVTAAVANHRREPGGMSVPYMDDFACIHPANVRDLEWWQRRFRDALGEETPRPAEVDLFKSLSPEELAKVKVPTHEEFQAALARGREDRKRAEDAIRPGGRGRYR